jgi:FixJ family two-component response regulator
MNIPGLEHRGVAGGPRAPLARVGIVDDDVRLLRALQRLLQVSGVTAITFDSGEAFLDALPTPALDCLVLDVRLGALSGFDVHDALVMRGESLPTIFITAHDEPATRQRARKAGAVAYLRKPFDEDSLISAIQSALGPGQHPG